MIKLFRGRAVKVTKSNSVTSWVYFVDDPEKVVFQVRTKWLIEA